MEGEDKVYNSLHEPQPEPINPEIYKSLTPEQKGKISELMARDAKISRGEALKQVLAEEKENQEA